MTSLVIAACHVPQTNPPPDASLDVSFEMLLSSRHTDLEEALAGLSVWVDSEAKEVGSGVPVAVGSFPNMVVARQHSFPVEIRFGEVLLDQVEQRPGDLCAETQGNNRLLSESVTLCVRSNGEVSVSDFSCEYEVSGFYTADVYCPTDCSPLAGRRVCGEDRCALVLTHESPRFGVMACMPAGELQQGQWCPLPRRGGVDPCADGLACVENICRAFCFQDQDCGPEGRCESALANNAEPWVCVDENAAVGRVGPKP